MVAITQMPITQHDYQITPLESLFLDHPPLVVLDEFLGVLDDGVEVVSFLVHFAVDMLGLEPGVLQHLQELNLLFGKVRVPEVYDQDQPCLLPLVPGLVLEAIIEHICLALLLLACLIAHPHATTTDTHEWQVKAQLFVGGAVVLHDVRFGGECAEKGVVVVIGDVLVNQLHCFGDLEAVVVELHVVQFQVEHIPGS